MNRYSDQYGEWRLMLFSEMAGLFHRSNAFGFRFPKGNKIYDIISIERNGCIYSPDYGRTEYSKYFKSNQQLWVLVNTY